MHFILASRTVNSRILLPVGGSRDLITQSKIIIGSGCNGNLDFGGTSPLARSSVTSFFHFKVWHRERDGLFGLLKAGRRLRAIWPPNSSALLSSNDMIDTRGPVAQTIPKSRVREAFIYTQSVNISEGHFSFLFLFSHSGGLKLLAGQRN